MIFLFYQTGKVHHSELLNISIPLMEAILLQRHRMVEEAESSVTRKPTYEKRESGNRIEEGVTIPLGGAGSETALDSILGMVNRYSDKVT